MASQCSLHRHLRRFQVAYLTDHDDIRVLTQQGAHTRGKVEINIMLNLHLVERRHHKFYRILYRADIDIWCRQHLQAAVQGCRFTRAGRTGDQQNAVGLLDHRIPDTRFAFIKPKRCLVFDQDLRVEDSHDHLLAKRCRHG